MRNIWQKLNLLLDKKQKRTMAGILFMMVIGAFLEMASVALLVATVKQLTQPDAVAEGKIAGTVYRIMGSPDFKVFSATVMGAFAGSSLTTMDLPDSIVIMTRSVTSFVLI